MDGTNAAGRKVSLLNDHDPPHLVRLPSITPSLRSRTSSYTGSPVHSPPTPQLVRSNSSDSTTMTTPSPVTPDYAFDFNHPLDSPAFSQNGFFPPQKELNAAYHQGPLPFHPAEAAQAAYFAQHQQPPAQQHRHSQQSQQQMHDQHVAPPAAAAAAASANGRPKKNSYPCPMAKQFNCNDYFTTSGHAARHAKKHTGKKDAFCPECNKAFTRKDNMEQHRRTHQSGRGSAKGSDRDVKKAKQKAQLQRAKESSLQPTPLQAQSASQALLQMDSPMVDPNLPLSPSESFMAPLQHADSFDLSPRYPDPTPYAMSHGYNPGQAQSYRGLDALAMAASGEERQFEN